MIYDLSDQFQRTSFQKRCEKLLEKGSRVELKVSRKKRSLQANALYWVWISVLADEFGYTDTEHCARDVKRALLGQAEVVNKFTGQVERADYRTSKFTKDQMQMYMEKIKLWASSEYGIYLPSPDEQGYDEMINRHSYGRT